MPRYVADTAPRKYVAKPAIASASDAARIVHAAIEHDGREHFVLVALDRRHRMISAAVLTIGSAPATVVDVRQVLVTALRADATAIIVGHNHPSADPAPSNEDINVTRRLRAGCDAVGVVLLDHIVVTADADVWVSLAERGY